MPLCPGCLCPGWIDTCLRGEFRREDTFLEQLTGGTHQSGPSEIGSETTWWLLDTHHMVWFGWKCPSCWEWGTRLSSLQGKEYYGQTVCKKQSVWIVRLCPVTLCHQVGPCISAQAHFMECCSPRFWCVLATATILWTVNSVLNTSTTCHVCMLLYMYCRAPCRALSMNLEPWTTDLHTCLYCVPRVSVRALICACVYLVYDGSRIEDQSVLYVPLIVCSIK